jgi:hypothetical protein
MALVKCPECNKEISDLAAACPHCGCPMAGAADKAEEAPPADEERTLYVTGPVIFRGRPGKTLIAVLIGCVAIFTLFGGFRDRIEGEWVRTTAWVLLGIAVVYMLWRWMPCASAELTITTERTICRRGFISRATTEVLHRDVKMVHTEQSLLQRILRVGSLGVGSAGHSGMEIQIEGIPNPTRPAALIRERQRT